MIKSHNSKWLLVIILCTGFILLYQQTFSQFSRETGFFPIKNFTPEDYNNALPKNSAIAQDNRGIMYFGNDEGVLEYDGIKWKLYHVSNEESIHSLATDKNGRVYVGSVNEFGYLLPNDKGDLEYKSLIGSLDESIKEFNEIWFIHSASDGIYFQSSYYIFKWDGKKISHWEFKNEIHTSFIINNKIYIKQAGKELICLNSKGFKEINGNLSFSDKAITAVLPLDEQYYLFVTQNHGFYKIKFIDDFSKVDVSPISPELNKLISNYELINTVKINENTYSIGTWGSGLLIYQNGKIVQLITRKSGLVDEVINRQFLDKDNNLWLALSDGITKIEINSPISKFTEELGVDGTIEAMERFNGDLYLATERGLLLLLSKEWADQNKIYEQNKLKKIQTFLGGLWDIKTYKSDDDNHLLIATDNAIIQMNKDMTFNTIYDCYPWRIYLSQINSKRIYIGLDNGLTSLVRKNNRWEVEYEFPEIKEKVFTIAEDIAGNIWLGTNSQGVLKVEINKLTDFKDLNIKRYNALNGVPENCDIYVILYDQKILFGTDKGIYEKLENKDSFIVSTRFPKELINTETIITRMKTDYNYRLWITTFNKSSKTINAGYIYPDSSGYIWVEKPFNTISKGDLYSIHFDEDNIVWFGGSEGLYRFDPHVNKNYEKEFATLIRLNIIDEDSTIFFGSYFDKNGYVTTIQPDVLKPSLKYKYNSLNFEFSAQNTEIEYPILFSYFLEGYDKKWSEWDEKGFERYTNLHEGNYIFRVKAKNIYEYQSKEASYEFEILPPWYRTIVAYILYLVVLVGLVFLIVTQYTKYLRAVIKEKTKEIRHQKEIVEKKNEEITDSIKYAKRIQEALLPPKEILVESNIDHFILFKPRDIVSGDFYWFRKIADFTVIVAADCTGHGVPGAFVSMLGMAFLNEIAFEIKEVKANYILNSLRALVIKSLRQTGKEGESKDGMDIALYVIDRKNMKLQFSGANNPLILIRNKEVIQVKADRMPIGFHLVMDEFQNNEIEIEKNDMLYTFSDGYQDQFGGGDGSKFKIKNLKELMIEICNKPLDEQCQIFDTTIENWKGTEEQIDDILLIGVRI